MKPIVKFFILLFILAKFSNTVGAQPQTSANTKRIFTEIRNKGFSFGVSESLESYYNLKGGIRSGSAWASTLDANMRIDLQKLLNLKGGMFYADLEYHAGDNPTSKLLGDGQVFDKHNADPFFQALEVWYQQELFNNKLRIKIGKVDANSEFSVIDNGLEFINSSTQVTPTHFVFPTFPDPVPSINLFFRPNKHFYTSFAMDEANQKGHFLNFYGDPTSVQPTLDGLLFMSESGFLWNHLPILGKDGNVKIGLWEHTGTFTKLDGNTQQGAQGFYLIANQTLWKPPLDSTGLRGIRTFLEFARTEMLVNPVYQHFGGGIIWTGLTAGNPEDALGFSTQYVDLSPELHLPKSYELNFELFYKILLTKFLNLKLDTQYIVHPGGQYPDALVGTLILNFNL